MSSLHDSVNVVQARQQQQWIWECASWGLLASGCCGSLLGVVRFLTASEISWPWIAGTVLAGPVLGAIFAQLTKRPVRNAAAAIDRSCGLKDRVTTSLGFQSSQINSPIHALQIADAEACLKAVDLDNVSPIETPRSWVWGVGAAMLAMLVMFVTSPPDQLSAAIVPDEVVSAQASRIEESLEELKEFTEQQQEPEVEKLLKELARIVEELKEPGVDPKEALAKLSEMEAALLDQQQMLSDPGTEAALQSIGEALSIAEPFQSAGQALSTGDLEKAAEELAKLELPKLDRQTEKGVTEKLEQAQQNQGEGMPRSLREAASQVAEGLSQGNRSKFKDGVSGLAGECQKQGRRKKLSDLLRKQCQCLSECKGECEKECQNQALSNKKGGKNAGLAASGNDPGEKTALLKTSPQMNITGQDSGTGDIDVETESAPEQQQEAVRQYREQARKYEQLSESVLDSEPIPLGHRQTIRRYFELIRPDNAETDAVTEQISPSAQ